ncbi:hypothetical protein [Geodermatophilus sp. SYSU D00815]
MGRVGPLLAAVGERAPADALRLAAVTSGDAGTGPAVDLSGMWARPAGPAAPRSNALIRTLDAKDRLMLPLTLAATAPPPAERDGAVLTVFPPGSAGRPRTGCAVAALPLDARSRLTSAAGSGVKSASPTALRSWPRSTPTAASSP